MRRLSGHIGLALTPPRANFMPSCAVHGLSSITRTSTGRLVTGGRVYFSTMLLWTLILKELAICQFWMSSGWRCPWVVACKEIASRSGSDRSGMTLPERLSATHWLNFSFVISSHLLPPLSPSLLTRPLDHQCKTNCKWITFHPTLTASHFPLSSLFVLFFLCTLGNDNQLLATAAWPQYAPEPSWYFSFSFLLTFPLLFFYLFPECSAQWRRIYLPIPDADPLTTRYDYKP